MDEHGDRTLDYATQARRIISRAVMNYEMKEGVTMEHVLLQVASMQENEQRLARKNKELENCIAELSGDSAADLLSMSSKLDGLRELVERLRRELTACQHENIELHEIIDLLRSDNEELRATAPSSNGAVDEETLAQFQVCYL